MALLECIHHLVTSKARNYLQWEQLRRATRLLSVQLPSNCFYQVYFSPQISPAPGPFF
jgi:hypothetical protein